MKIEQSIPSPNGITVYGSGRTRVEPNYASFQFTITVKNKQARRAFKQLQQKIIELRKGLVKRHVKDSDIQVSHLTADKEQMFLGTGTAAVTTISIKICDLETLQDILVYIIDNDCRLITSVSFGTTQLKNKRIEARIRAIEAAQEKAQVYAGATGVVMGKPIHIEDLNPDALEASHHRIDHFTGRLERMEVESIIEDEGIFDASWLPVDAAVMVTYEIIQTHNEL